VTLGSLFDGIGGWQLAAIHNGVKPIWSSEIEAFPCAVTKKHFPDTLQLGDITKLNGAELPPVDIICAGSPCQDLSVAGKQEGLKGARSGLFMDAIRIVREMRAATGGKSPRYFVWENVPGAFSSNSSADFRAVLEEIAEAEIPMPDNNKWADAGVVEWDGGSLAWRVLDAQYWGVPQRRRRIFLVADFGGQCAGEILFEREGSNRNIETGREAREGLAARAESGVGSASVVRMRAGCAGGGKGALVSRERSLTLAANTNDQVLFVPDKARSLTARNDGSPCVDRGPDIIAAGVVSKGNGEAWLTPEQHTSLTSGGGQAGQGYPCVMTAAGFKVGNSEAAHSIGYAVETSPTLSAMDSGNKPAVAVYDMTHADEVMRPVDGDKVQTLNARMGTGGNQVPVISYAIQGNTIDRQLQNGANGKGVLEEKSYTLNTIDRHAVAHLGSGKETVGCLMANCGTKQWLGNQEAFSGDFHVVTTKTVRRLTPTECERLQGLPDGYTLIDDKTCSDTARYKALGNGMAQPCADYVIRRIREATT